MLSGSYSHSIDVKGRLFMPVRFREELGERFWVTRGIGNCLFVFSDEEWTGLAKKLSEKISLTDQKSQVFLRMLFASASECEPDKQGRILLPARLRDYAGITEEAVVIGVMSRAEIWSPAQWDAYNSAASEDYEETLAKLAELGI